MYKANTNPDRTELIKEWSQIAQKPISEEEYLEIRRNLRAFFEILYKWNKDSKLVPEP
jgi:hypothetical protein